MLRHRSRPDSVFAISAALPSAPAAQVFLTTLPWISPRHRACHPPPAIDCQIPPTAARTPPSGPCPKVSTTRP
eukprot:3750810-Karenia_brevis.AAC.1